VVSGAIFGSSARSDARPESDFDVLLLVTDRASAEAALDRLLDAAPDLAKQFGIRLSPLLLEVEEWHERIRAGDSFVTRASKDAIPFLGDPALVRLHD
jgi:predicted nucleotidyltransferase